MDGLVMSRSNRPLARGFTARDLNFVTAPCSYCLACEIRHG